MGRLVEWITQVAQSTFFDNSTNGFVSTNVQAAIEENKNASDLSVSPGYAFGREGVHTNGTWLIATEAVSNKRGLPFGLDNGFVKKITVSTLNIPAAFDIEIYYHDGNLSGSTLVGTITTTNTASTEDFIVDFAIPKGHQLAVRVSNVGNPKPQETGVFLVVKGTVS